MLKEEELSRTIPVINVLFKWNGATSVVPIHASQARKAFFFETAAGLSNAPLNRLSLRVNNSLVLYLPCFSSLGLLDMNEKQNGNSESDEENVLRLLYKRNPHHIGEITFITVDVLGRLVGGKGGFGSLLRGQRGSRRRAKNFDSCRDLSGRRIYQTKAIERLTLWLEKKQRDNALIKALCEGGKELTSTLLSTRQTKTNTLCNRPSLDSIGEAYFLQLNEALYTTKEAVQDAFSAEKATKKHSDSFAKVSSDDALPSLSSNKGNESVRLGDFKERCLRLNARYCDMSLMENDSTSESDGDPDNEFSLQPLITSCATQCKFSSLLKDITSSAT